MGQMSDFKDCSRKKFTIFILFKLFSLWQHLGKRKYANDWEAYFPFTFYYFLLLLFFNKIK